MTPIFEHRLAIYLTKYYACNWILLGEEAVSFKNVMYEKHVKQIV